MQTTITRADAKALRMTRYYTGEPCKHGHIAERRVSDGKCILCESESIDARREKIRTYGKTYRAAKRERRESRQCVVCDRDISEKHSYAKVCSTVCANALARSLRALKPRPKCLICGEDIVGMRRGAKTCSAICQRKHANDINKSPLYRKRRRVRGARSRQRAVVVVEVLRDTLGIDLAPPRRPPKSSDAALAAYRKYRTVHREERNARARANWHERNERARAAYHKRGGNAATEKAKKVTAARSALREVLGIEI